MPSHAPRSQPSRKAEILEKRIDELIHAIRHGYGLEKLNTAAERVRFAQIKLCKGKMEQFRPFCTEDAQPNKAARVKREIDEWESHSVEEIVSKYSGNA